MQNQATAEIQKLNSALGQTSETAQKSGSIFSGLGGTLAALGLSYLTIEEGIIKSVEAYDEEQKTLAILQAQLKATGDASGETMKEMYDLAYSQQFVTGTSKDQYLAAEGVILRYQNIKNDIFPQVIKLSADMSVAMGTEMSASAKMLGMALNDPTTALGRLTRAGVQFSTAQKEEIATAQKTNDIHKQMGIILDAVNEKFGGVAEAAGSTFAGRLNIAKNTVNELQEGIGGGLVNALEVSTGVMNASGDDIAHRVEEWRTAIANYVSGFVIGIQLVAKEFWDACNLIGTGLYNIGNIVSATMKDSIAHFTNFGKEMGQVGKIMNDLVTGQFSQAWSDIGQMSADGMANTTAAINEGMQNSTDAFNAFSNDASNAMNQMGQAMTKNSEGFKTDATGVASGFDDMGKAAKDSSTKMQDAAKKIADVKQQIKDLNNSFKQELSNLKDTLETNISTNQQDLAKNIADQLLATEKDAADQKLAITNATTDDEKKTALDKYNADEKLLADHAADFTKYADEIKQEEAFNNMDSIDQAKYTAQQQVDVLKAQYDEDVKNAKKAHDEKLEELKKSLKDAENEYKKFFQSIADMEDKVGSVSVTSKFSYKAPKKKLATGTNYVPQDMVAMIHEGEAVVPKEYNPFATPTAGQLGGGNANYNFNFSGAIISDKQGFVKIITDEINRKIELRKLGSTV
jgi:hypothetical protein